MKAKSWVVMCLLLALALVLAVAALNFFVDPFGVFGQNVWYSYAETLNPRVGKTAYLMEHADEYDSYLVGCSSTSSYPAEELNEYLDAKFYNTIVYGADMQDTRLTVAWLLEHCTVKNIVLNVYIDNGLTFEIVVTVFHGQDSASVRIVNYHTNIVHIERNGQVLLDTPVEGESEAGLTDRSCLNLRDILDFAETVDIADVKDVLDRQIEYNSAIAKEGLRGNYGSNIGSVLLQTYGEGSVMVRAKAMAAAGSDARMNGCEMPVVINSGSGNQGMTTSLPVIEYAKELKVSDEKLYRALCLSNLTTIHQKTSIGRLSAFCGAVSAGAGAGAGIAYLLGSDLDGISHTVANAIATTGGIVCDGAKASCASKIATAVEAGILGYNMHIQDQDFQPDDGLVGDTPEDTISNIGRLGKEGMKSTNEEIIKIMVGN